MAARTGRLAVIKKLKKKGDSLERKNIVCIFMFCLFFLNMICYFVLFQDIGTPYRFPVIISNLNKFAAERQDPPVQIPVKLEAV